MTRPRNRNTIVVIDRMTKYSVRSFSSGITPNRRPRGTPCKPSSPPVNGAWTQKKNSICAKANVTIAK